MSKVGKFVKSENTEDCEKNMFREKLEGVQLRPAKVHTLKRHYCSTRFLPDLNREIMRGNA
jgi:hypothetical protein